MNLDIVSDKSKWRSLCLMLDTIERLKLGDRPRLHFLIEFGRRVI